MFVLYPNHQLTNTITCYVYTTERPLGRLTPRLPDVLASVPIEGQVRSSKLSTLNTDLRANLSNMNIAISRWLGKGTSTESQYQLGC